MTTVDMKPIFEEFYAKAEALASEAKALDADATQRTEALARHTQQDAQDRAALAEMERQVTALKAKVDAQAQDLAARRASLEAVEQERDRKKAEAEAIVAIVEREKTRLANEIKPPSLTLLPGAASAESEQESGPAGVTLRDPLPGRPIGALEHCPGCLQPISWDGLGWTHGTVTDCTADLAAFSPQQGGGAS